MQVRIEDDNGKLCVRVEGRPENDTEALANCIEKWTLMLQVSKEKGEPVSTCGEVTCALCMLYFDDRCEGCPIYERTGYTRCHDTPYDEYVDSLRYARANQEDYWQGYLQTIEDELAFLKSLKVEA